MIKSKSLSSNSVSEKFVYIKFENPILIASDNSETRCNIYTSKPSLKKILLFIKTNRNAHKINPNSTIRIKSSQTSQKFKLSALKT